MKEVIYEAFCDTKSLLLWAKKLLRDHRQELGGGMYAHIDRLEWVWPGEGQSMELLFVAAQGGSRMIVKFPVSLEAKFSLVDGWARASGKVRPSTEPIASPAEAGEDADDEAEEGLFPTDLIQQRWGAYTVDERAYATCLFECVRYEHLVRKHLPSGALEAAERRGFEPTDENAGANREASDGVSPPEPRRTLGFISSVFSNHPAIRPILEACGTCHHFWLINDFRNSLIHVRTSKQLSPTAIRKRYRRLQVVICLLQRWTDLEKLYQAITAFDERRRPSLEGLGPRAHVCRLIKHLGAEGLTTYYGISSPEALRLAEIATLFVVKTSLRAEGDYMRAIADLEKLN
jgi:hypothetical protein